MANRIIDLDKRGLQWKKFYNINMSARLAEKSRTRWIVYWIQLATQAIWFAWAGNTYTNEI
jgi:hypothetical protein